VPTDSDRDATVALAETIGGWLTTRQARVLWDAAVAIPAGSVIVEIGSHQGRSTVVLARAAAGCRVVAIDPFEAGGMFGGPATRQAFLANLAAAQVSRRVELRQARSAQVRRDWQDRIQLLYIDGKHDYWTVSDDLRWTEFVDEGACLLVHDAFSSVGVTLALLAHVLGSRRLRYAGREGSLASFQVAPPRAVDRLRMLAQLGWWMRNVSVKVVRRVSRLFGGTRPDPF
jgi:hypothetical protein